MPKGDPMRLTGRIEVNKVTLGRIADDLPAMAEEMIQGLVEAAADIARAMVAPHQPIGMHPGPHPHPTNHTDTGSLMESIKTAYTPQGLFVTGAVYTDLEYGAHLEYGFHVLAKAIPGDPTSGFIERFYRYPFITPAIQQAARDLDSLFGVTARRWLSQQGTPGTRKTRELVETFVV